MVDLEQHFHLLLGVLDLPEPQQHIFAEDLDGEKFLGSLVLSEVDFAGHAGAEHHGGMPVARSDREGLEGEAAPGAEGLFELLLLLPAPAPLLRRGAPLALGGPLDVYSASGIGYLAQYFCVGLIYGGLPATVYGFFLGYLNVPAHVYATVHVIMTLPWSFKFAFGLLNDCAPIGGYRRKPYMVIGWAICCAVLLRWQQESVRQGQGAAPETTPGRGPISVRPQ